MTPERARELLGGLSTGILTPEERQTLFEAALHDQAIFNEVADELEFGAFLQSPETRAQLANRIEVEPESARWWALRPGWLALSGVLAASAVLTVVLWHRPGETAREPVAVTAPPPVAAPAGVNGARQGDALQNKTETASAKPATHQRQKEAAQAMSAQPAHARKQEAAPADKDAPSETAKAEDGKATVSIASPGPEQRDTASGGPAPARPAAPIPAPKSMYQTTPQPVFRGAPMRAAGTPPAVPPPPAAASGAIAGFGGTPLTASLEGTVHDASGTAVKNAAIDIVNNATNTTTHAVSDAAGRFVAPPLAPGGPYTVTAAAPGFKKEERTGITLAVNQPARIDIPLQVGAVSQTVEIQASANSVQLNQFNSPRQVAVLDFVNGTSQSQSGQQAADFLSSQLDDSGQVRVIDREKVQQAQQAQAQSRPPSAKQAADLGRRLGADAVIVGTVKAPATGNSNIAVTAQVIDTKKARAMSKVAANGASLQGATNSLGLALESQLAVPLEGDVTSVEQNTVTVAFKAPATPRIGAQFDVYRGKRKIGQLTLTSAYGQSAAGTFSGAGKPRAGDRVSSSR